MLPAPVEPARAEPADIEGAAIKSQPIDIVTVVDASPAARPAGTPSGGSSATNARPMCLDTRLQIRPAEFSLSRQRGTGDPIAAVTAVGANRDQRVA